MSEEKTIDAYVLNGEFCTEKEFKLAKKIKELSDKNIRLDNSLRECLFYAKRVAGLNRLDLDLKRDVIKRAEMLLGIEKAYDDDSHYVAFRDGSYVKIVSDDVDLYNEYGFIVKTGRQLNRELEND